MPYSKSHKRQTKERILRSAVELFCHKGFANVSIDDLMRHADLTRGAFYAHFKSKSDVYMQSITSAAYNSRIINEIPEEVKGKDWLERFLNSYLSSAHINDEVSPCPMAFMVTDVASNDPNVKKTYTTVFESFTKLVKQHLPQNDDPDLQAKLSFAISAMVIGSVAIGRALDDKNLQKELLRSSQAIATLLSNNNEPKSSVDVDKG